MPRVFLQKHIAWDSLANSFIQGFFLTLLSSHLLSNSWRYCIAFATSTQIRSFCGLGQQHLSLDGVNINDVELIALLHKVHQDFWKISHSNTKGSAAKQGVITTVNQYLDMLLGQPQLTKGNLWSTSQVDPEIQNCRTKPFTRGCCQLSNILRSAGGAVKGWDKHNVSGLRNERLKLLEQWTSTISLEFQWTPKYTRKWDW